MQVDDLRDILTHSPTDCAAVSALTVLIGLARDGDFPATIALVRALAEEIGYDPDMPALSATRSLQELLAAPDLPSLLRVYAYAFMPREFLAKAGAFATLSSDALSPQTFAAFKRLVRRDAVLQHEALKAYVLYATAMQQAMLQDTLGGGAPHGAQLHVLDQVLSQCRVVPGEVCDATPHLGRDIILRVRDAKTFFSPVLHELGHILFESMVGSAPPSSSTLPHTSYLPALAASLPMVMEGARRFRGKAFQHADPRRLKMGSGVSILCSHARLQLGAYFHWSLTQEAGPIDLHVGALYAFFILSVLGINLSQIAVAYSRRGVFHFGFAGDDTELEACLERVEQADAHKVAAASSANSQSWIDELMGSGQIGESLEYVPVSLGVAHKAETFYGVNRQRSIEDWNLVASARLIEAPQMLTDQETASMLAATWRFAEADHFRRLVLSRSAPEEFLSSARLPLAEIGESLCAIWNENGISCAGPTAADIRRTLLVLCEFGGDMDKPVDETGRTLLIRAVGKGADQVRFLLECGANPNHPGADGDTPLIACASHGSAEAVKALIAGSASVNAHGQDGNTALHRAIASEEIEIAQVLLANGADVDARNNTGETPLMLAESGIAVDLLCQSGAKIDTVTPSGNTALLGAAAAAQPSVIRALLVHGADPNATNALGETALYRAVLLRSGMECVQALLEAGADVEEETNKGMTPLGAAAASGNAASVDALIAAGAEVNACDPDGNTPLLLAIKAGRRGADAVGPLLDAGASVTRANAAGETALQLVAQGNVAEDVRNLIRASKAPSAPGGGAS